MDRFKLFDNFYCISKNELGVVFISRNGLQTPASVILLREETNIKRNGDYYFISPFDVLRISTSTDLAYPFLTIYDLFNRLTNVTKSGKSSITIKDLIIDYKVDSVCTS